MWRPVCIRFERQSVAVPWLLGSLGMILALAGCESTSGSGSTGRHRKLDRGRQRTCRTNRSNRQGARQTTHPRQASPRPKWCRQIEGDRMTVVARPSS